MIADRICGDLDFSSIKSRKSEKMECSPQKIRTAWNPAGEKKGQKKEERFDNMFLKFILVIINQKPNLLEFQLYFTEAHSL